MFRCITCNMFHMRQFFRFFYSLAWFDTVEFQLPAYSKQRDVRRCGFCWSIQLSIDYVWNSSINRAISTRSCSYCVWNRSCQNLRSIFANFQLIAWFDTLAFNRLPCSNNKMFHDAVYTDRFRYQLTMFWSVYIDRVISTPWYSCCIWNSYIKNHHW